MPHTVEMPKYVIDRIMAKRGRLNVFDSFDAPKTALVVIDMQKFFVNDVPTAQSIVPNINRLANVMRERGGLVAWVLMTLADAPDAPSKWPLYHDYFFTPEKTRAHKTGLTLGDPGHPLVDALEPKAQDVTAHKTRFSAFIQGSSDLHQKLQSRGIENLIVTGTVTNFCCETSARDAMMLGYRVVMASDGCAARYDEDHLAGLTSFWQSFGDVRTVDEAIAMLRAPTRIAAE